MSPDSITNALKKVEDALKKVKGTLKEFFFNADTIAFLNFGFFILLIIFSIFINLCMIPFSIDPHELNENISIGTPANFTIFIKNTGFNFSVLNFSVLNYDQDLNYSLNGLDETWLDAKGFDTNLPTGENKFIPIKIVAPAGTPPGRYNGEIILSSDLINSNSSPMSRFGRSKWEQRIKLSLRMV